MFFIQKPVSPRLLDYSSRNQWSRILLPMQETSIPDPGGFPYALEQLSLCVHNYWACVLGPWSYNYWAHMAQLVKALCPRTRALQQDKPLQ